MTIPGAPSFSFRHTGSQMRGDGPQPSLKLYSKLQSYLLTGCPCHTTLINRMFARPLLLLAVSSFALGISGSNHDNQQFVIQPVIQPHDNFNLTPVRDALISNKIIGDVLDDFEPKYYLDVVYPKHDIRVMLGTEIKPKHVKKRPRFGIHVVPDRNAETDMSEAAVAPSFTLILTDPDATSRYDPKWSEMCHWIVTNLTSSKSGSLSGLHEIEDILNGDLDSDSDSTGLFRTKDPSDEHDEQASGNDKKSTRPKKHNKHMKDRKHTSKKKDKKLPGELESYFAPAPPPKTGWHRYVFVLLEGDTTNLVAPKERKHWGYGEVRHGVRDWALENGLEVVGANFFFAMNKKQ